MNFTNSSHKVRLYGLLFLGGLILYGLAALFLQTPGYMDADYYFATGQQLARNYGFSEPFLWNYLNDPNGLPQPSHAYWMPLASLIAAAGLALAPEAGFRAGQAPFVLLAACLPPLCAWLANELAQGQAETRRRFNARLAGLLALFPGFYLPFLVTSDTFGLYMLLGAVSLAAMGSLGVDKDQNLSHGLRRRSALAAGISGAAAGMMHLARADGVLWLGMSLLACAGLTLHSPDGRLRVRIYWQLLPVCLGGYLLVMGAWFWRNELTFGSLLPPGNTKTLWLLHYDELYAYPATLLTPARWWEAGIVELLRVRIWALGQNLQTALAVQGSIFLAPLILIGGWQLRRDRRVRFGALAWLATIAVMTLVFPLAGARGGFFHSGAAVQLLFWALVPVGLNRFIAWGNRSRGWDVHQASLVFSAGILGLAAIFTGFLFIGRFDPFSTIQTQAGWDAGARHYVRLEKALNEHGAVQGEIVMVNNPPGYFLHAGRPAIGVPNGDIDTLRAAAVRYHARYLLLEKDRFAAGLDGLYAQPEAYSGLEYLETIDGTHIFRFQ